VQWAGLAARQFSLPVVAYVFEMTAPAPPSDAPAVSLSKPLSGERFSMMRLTPHHRVVIADTDPVRLERVARLVSGAGCQTFRASCAAAALALLDQLPESLLVAGCGENLQPGLELCRAARHRRERHELFILLMAEGPSGDHSDRVLHQEADDIVHPQAQQGELLARLASGIRVLELRKELYAAHQAAASNLDALAARADEIAATRDVAVFALAKLAESRDPETGEHLERLRSYSQILAEELHETGPCRDLIDHAFLDNLYRSSPLHDIGKVGIPDAILRKPGRLTPDEFEIMKQHTTIGAEALEKAMHLSGCGGFLSMAVDIARYHHERFDGSGYPSGLSGLDIPLAARIVALADVYDALTSVRVYKDAYEPEVARSMILEQEGRHFDPLVVDAFRARFGDFVDVRRAIERPCGEFRREAIPLAG
jgi:putative two-component system response regulator